MPASTLSPDAVRLLLQEVPVPRERHQDGWVRETGKKLKKWEGHWHPYDENGKRGHASVILGLKSKMRKWEAEDALRKHIEKVTGQRAKCPADPAFSWFWENAYLPSRTWGPAMRSTMQSLFTRHVLPKFGEVKLSDLDKLTIQEWIVKLAGAWSRSLVKKALVQVRAMLEEAVERDLIAKNPARKVAMPATRKPCGRFLTLEEYDALTAQLEFRDRLIVRLFVGTGLRPGELFALRWNDVEPGRLRVDESASPWGIKEPKTDESDAFVRLPPDLQADLMKWAHGRKTLPASLIFPARSGEDEARETAIAYHNYERDVIVPAAIRAEIMAAPPKKRKKGEAKRDKATAVNFQAFRRTFATWMQKTGATVKDVQAAMRHSTPDQTLKAYMKAIPPSVAAAVDGLDRILSEKRGITAETKGGVQ